MNRVLILTGLLLFSNVVYSSASIILTEHTAYAVSDGTWGTTGGPAPLQMGPSNKEGVAIQFFLFKPYLVTDVGGYVSSIINPPPTADGNVIFSLFKGSHLIGGDPVNGYIPDFNNLLYESSSYD